MSLSWLFKALGLLWDTEGGISHHTVVRLWMGQPSRAACTNENRHSPVDISQLTLRLVVTTLASPRMETIGPSDTLWVGIGPGRSGGIGSHGDEPFDPTSIYWLFRKYAKAAGLDLTRVSLHSMRHAGIQQRILADQEITAIMRVSGHRDLRVFMSYSATLNTADTGASLLSQRFNFLGVK